MWAEPSGLLLTHVEWDVASVISLHKIMTSILLADSLCWLFGLYTLKQQAAVSESPCGKRLRVGSGLQPARNQILPAARE